MFNKTIILIIIVLICVTIIGSLFLILRSNSQLGDLTEEAIVIDKETADDILKEQEESFIEVQERQTFGESYNIGVYGLDTRNNDYSGRSDMMLVLNIDKQHQAIKMISFMRDLRVDIEDYGMDKLGHAYAYGKEMKVRNTINDNFGVYIDEYITLNFESMSEIIDILGGVEITVKGNEVTHIPDIESEGLRNLNGPQALAYSRIRKTGNGDFERTERQRTVFKATALKLTEYSEDDLLIKIALIYELLETSLNIDQIYEEIVIYDSFEGVYLTSLRIPFDGEFEEQNIDGLYYLVIKDFQITNETIRSFLYDKNEVKYESD